MSRRRGPLSFFVHHRVGAQQFPGAEIGIEIGVLGQEPDPFAGAPRPDVLPVDAGRAFGGAAQPHDRVRGHGPEFHLGGDELVAPAIAREATVTWSAGGAGNANDGPSRLAQAATNINIITTRANLLPFITLHSSLQFQRNLSDLRGQYQKESVHINQFSVQLEPVTSLPFE